MPSVSNNHTTRLRRRFATVDAARSRPSGSWSRATVAVMMVFLAGASASTTASFSSQRSFGWLGLTHGLCRLLLASAVLGAPVGLDISIWLGPGLLARDGSHLAVVLFLVYGLFHCFPHSQYRHLVLSIQCKTSAHPCAMRCRPRETSSAWVLTCCEWGRGEGLAKNGRCCRTAGVGQGEKGRVRSPSPRYQR